MKKLIVISLLISLPVFVWAVTTQKFDLRNKAASGDETPSVVSGQRCPSENTRNIIRTIWNYQRPLLTNNIKTYFETNKDSYVLYNTQIYTNNLLEMAVECSDTTTLNEIVKLYLTAYPYLTTSPSGHSEWLCGNTTCAGYTEGTPKEVILTSAQFVYVLSRTADILAQLPPSSLTPEMNDFLQKYIPVINDHLHKWIFESTGFRGMNHKLYLEKKLNRGFVGSDPAYLNAVSDTSMWIIASSAEMLAANDRSTLIPLTPQQLTDLHDHVDLGTRLIQSRLTETNLTNFAGQAVKGYDFDEGAWANYTDEAYCGYTGTTFPVLTDKSTCPTTSWDFSHARRFVNVFSALHGTRFATGQSFPDDTVLTKLANQVAYRIFNKDFDRPLFVNYWNGSNGWYRVNYSGRMGFGYAPFDLSLSFPTGGYGLWGKYNPDIDTIMQSVWKILDSSDPQTVAFRDAHYGTMYQNYQRTAPYNFSKTASVNFLQMLPTFVGSNNLVPTVTPSSTPLPTITATPTTAPTTIPTNTPTTTPHPTIAPTSIPTNSPSSSPQYTPGDLNHDGKVDLFDYNTMITHFGETGTPGFISADINSDGKVDIFDYNTLISNFGK